MATVVGAAAGVAADTLYLRDGSRVEGELIRVDNRRVEFREGRGWGSKTLQFDLNEVKRIDFEDRGGSWGNSGGNDRPGLGNDRPGLGNDRPGGGGDRPGGMREREVVVSADVPWVDTGIDVRSGQTVYFQTLGKVRWGKNRQDGPDGENNSPRNPGRPMPNRPGAALLGSVGGAGQDMFFIGGDTGAFRVRGSGRLYLGINDDVFTDNSGNFRVTVFF
jgi:hypothetical protein